MSELKNAKPGDVFRSGSMIAFITRHPVPIRISFDDGASGRYHHYDQIIIKNTWTRLVPERTLTKLQPGEVIPAGVRYVKRYNKSGNITSYIANEYWKVCDNGADYYLDPIPELPDVEPEPVKAPQFIGVVDYESGKLFVHAISRYQGEALLEGLFCRKDGNWEADADFPRHCTRDSATAAANGITESPEFLAAFPESEARDE